MQELTFAKRLYKHEVRGWQDAALAVRGDNSRAAATRAALAAASSADDRLSKAISIKPFQSIFV